MVQVHHDEGVANRIDPESCADAREGIGEALTGERIGQPLSRDSTLILGADVVPVTKATRMGAIVRAPRRPGVVLDTGMCGRSLLGNRETPRLTTGHLPDWSASGRRGAVADDERTRGVRLRHSSWEADEQGGAIRCGAGGAKGGGQGKCGPAKHAPGAEPGERVPGAGAHTANCKAKEEGEVHRALPPRQYRSPRGRIL